MKEIVDMEDLRRVMVRWLKCAKALSLTDMFRDDYIRAERAFLYGAFTEILGKEPEDIWEHHIPPIVFLCFKAVRPVASIGDWDKNTTDKRLAGASEVW